MYTTQLRKHIDNFVDAWYFKRTKFAVKTTWQPLQDMLTKTAASEYEFLVMYSCCYYLKRFDKAKDKAEDYDAVRFRISINMLSPQVNGERLSEDINHLLASSRIKARTYETIEQHAIKAYHKLKKKPIIN